MPETLDKKTSRVKNAPYKGIQTELTRRVRYGLWAKGAMIPSRRALAEEFQVSVPTVQKAISDMIADGILRVDANRTFVFGDADQSVNHGEPAVVSPITQARSVKVGTVALVAAVRVGDTGHIANGWPVVMINEAEHILSCSGLQFVFVNRFDAELSLHNTSHMLTELQKGQVDQAVIDEILRRRPSAVIAFGEAVMINMHRFVRKMQGAGILVVIVEPPVPEGLGCPAILYDNVDAGRQAATHLIERGSRRLLFFSPFESSWVHQRLIGCRLACAMSDQVEGVPTEYIGKGDISDLQSVNDFVNQSLLAGEHAKAYLAKGRDFDGVVASNDLVAAGFKAAAAEKGMRPGRDFLLIGFDDKRESRDLGLSSMHPPVAAMGREAAIVVTKLLQSQNEISAIVLRARLVARMSTNFNHAEMSSEMD